MRKKKLKDHENPIKIQDDKTLVYDCKIALKKRVGKIKVLEKALPAGMQRQVRVRFIISADIQLANDSARILIVWSMAER